MAIKWSTKGHKESQPQGLLSERIITCHISDKNQRPLIICQHTTMLLTNKPTNKEQTYGHTPPAPYLVEEEGLYPF